METTTLKSYDWLRKIPGDLFSLDEKPLLGFAPPFPFDAYSKELCSLLQIENVTISLEEIKWRSHNELFSGLGENVRGIKFLLNPVPGNIWFAIPENGFKVLVQLLQQSSNSIDFIDPDFLNAYLEFFALESVRAYENINVDKKLSPTVVRINELPEEACLGIDINIKHKDGSVTTRLLLSPEFRKAWMQRNLQSDDKLISNESLSDSLDVIVHLEAGKIDLKPSEWQKLSIGDFVLLDRCSLDLDGDKGRVMLVINGTPCFRAKIKQGNLKILEHPLYFEVDKPMPTSDKKNSDDHDDLFDDDKDFSDEYSEDSSEHSDEYSVEQSAEHSDEHSDELSFEHSDEFSDSEFDIEDEKSSEKSAISSAPKTKEISTPSKPVGDTKALADKKAANTPLNIEEIPLNVVIEVGRIQMSVKKLLELQPGNMLELDIHPETNVDMVVNGKRIAKGELLKIGDALGLRIISLS